MLLRSPSGVVGAILAADTFGVRIPANDVTAWSTLVLAFFAGVALVVALVQIREARALRQATHRAYVTIHLEGDKATRAINLVMENTGRSAATNVIVDFDPALQAAHSSINHAQSSAVWRQPSMPPGKVIRTVLDHGGDRAQSDLPTTFVAIVTYDSPATNEKEVTQAYPLDLHASAYAIRQWDLVDQDTPKQTRALESIASSLKKIAEKQTSE